MCSPSRILLACVCSFLCFFLAAPVWAQGYPEANPVYVSGGPYIYNVNGATLGTPIYDATAGPIYGMATKVNAYTGPYFSSLVIGPDNVDGPADGNAAHLFLLYACDNNTNTILRFDPTIPPAEGQTNPDAEVLHLEFAPTCGRFTSTGDLYVTSGSSVYEIKGAASIPFNKGDWASAGSAVSQVLTASTPAEGKTPLLEGTTEKNVGDLLVVDQANNQVLRSPYANPFSTFDAGAYASSGLSAPMGIARLSTGEVLVSNSTPTNAASGPTIPVADFASTGSPTGATCPAGLTFPDGATNTSLFFLAAGENDVVYAAASQPQFYAGDYLEDLDFQIEGGYPGAVWMWSPPPPNTPANCTLTLVASSQTQLSGVAVAPIAGPTISNVPLNATSASPTPAIFDFNSSELQLIGGGGCTPMTTAYPLSLFNIGSMINLAQTNMNGGLPNGAKPIVNLGEGGYEVGYTSNFATPTEGCTPVLGNPATFGNIIFGHYDSSLVTNPVVIRCDYSTDEPFIVGGETACWAEAFLGAYPISGPLPNDGGGGGRTLNNSIFFLANANPPSNTSEQGQYCNLIPLNGTTFDLDDFMVVAFQIREGIGNCKSGPFVGDATVNLSIAETSPNFSPILQLKPQGATFREPATYPIPCKTGSNLGLICTYALVVNLKASGITTPGTYELAVTSANAGTQAITFTVITGD
jgi:hypothetical protein